MPVFWPVAFAVFVAAVICASKAAFCSFKYPEQEEEKATPSVSTSSSGSSPLVTEQYGVKPIVQPKVPEKKEEYKAPDIYENMIVIHKTFGEGTIIKIDKAQKYFHVKFQNGEKTFVYPNTFQSGFLKIKEL